VAQAREHGFKSLSDGGRSVIGVPRAIGAVEEGQHQVRFHHPRVVGLVAGGAAPEDLPDEAAVGAVLDDGAGEPGELLEVVRQVRADTARLRSAGQPAVDRPPRTNSSWPIVWESLSRWAGESSWRP